MTSQPCEDLELEDILDHLIPMGFPTFDQFSKNPEKYRVGAEDLFKSADGSTTHKRVRDHLKEQRYYWKDEYDCGKSLEQVESIAKREGFQIADLEMVPKVFHMDGTSKEGRIEIRVQFWPKEELKAAGGIVANEK